MVITNKQLKTATAILWIGIISTGILAACTETKNIDEDKNGTIGVIKESMPKSTHDSSAEQTPQIYSESPEYTQTTTFVVESTWPVDRQIPMQPLPTRIESSIDHYDNCRHVWDVLDRPLYAYEQGYDTSLDSNLDGIACETEPTYTNTVESTTEVVPTTIDYITTVEATTTPPGTTTTTTFIQPPDQGAVEPGA